MNKYDRHRRIKKRIDYQGHPSLPKIKVTFGQLLAAKIAGRKYTAFWSER